MGARFSAPVQTVPGAHLASSTMGTGSFLGGKERQGRDADPLPPSSAVVMNGLCTSRRAYTELQCLYKGALYLFYHHDVASENLEHSIRPGSIQHNLNTDIF